MYSKKFISIPLGIGLFLFTFLFITDASGQQNIEFDYNDNSIGKSLQMQFQKKIGPLYGSIGIRYHIKEVVKYNEGNVYYKTMYPVNFTQHFGSALSLIYVLDHKNLIADFFIGYKTEIARMASRILFAQGIPTRDATFFNVDSPLVRWDNQLIAGAYLPFHKKVDFKIYGGLGVSGIFNTNGPTWNNKNRTHEFSASFGFGLSYKLN